MTALELAERLGVHHTTLKTWEKCLNIEVPRDHLGARQYDDALVALFTNIAQLRKEGYTYAQIARTLRDEDAPENAGENGDRSAETSLIAGEIAPIAPAQLDLTQLMELVQKLESSQKQLCDAHYQIGRLEERSKNLEHQVQLQGYLLKEKEERILLLMAPAEPPPEPAPPAEPAGPSWWRRWFNFAPEQPAAQA